MCVEDIPCFRGAFAIDSERITAGADRNAVKNDWPGRYRFFAVWQAATANSRRKRGARKNIACINR
jgi:hypothetical protein